MRDLLPSHRYPKAGQPVEAGQASLAKPRAPKLIAASSIAHTSRSLIVICILTVHPSSSIKALSDLRCMYQRVGGTCGLVQLFVCVQSVPR